MMVLERKVNGSSPRLADCRLAWIATIEQEHSGSSFLPFYFCSISPWETLFSSKFIQFYYKVIDKICLTQELLFPTDICSSERPVQLEVVGPVLAAH